MSPADADRRVYRAGMAKQTRSDGKAPWERKRPEGAKKTKLTAASRAKAKGRARKAGRKYPNLVDNMRAAAEQRSRKKSPVRRQAQDRRRAQNVGQEVGGEAALIRARTVRGKRAAREARRH